MGQYARNSNIRAPRIAVGRILDYTGKADVEGGRRVTQGASLMAMSAFAKAGARLVERFDTSVTEMELNFKNNKLIEDGNGSYAKITAGEVGGSDFYLVGGITELNYNIRSVGGEAFIGDTDAYDPKGTVGAKMFVINVAIDLRMVETKTLNVVDVISYQKQIIGREVSLGVFDFANGNVFDVGVGGRSQEPIQLAVRSTIERAVLEMMANMYGARIRTSATTSTCWPPPTAPRATSCPPMTMSPTITARCANSPTAPASRPSVPCAAATRPARRLP
ncbi:MAG: holdfast anchoring protein HfaB [Hyphomonas sp.]